MSNLLQINTADPSPASGTNNYLLTPTTTSGYPTAAACQTATAAVGATTLTSTASRPAYTSSCIPLVNHNTGAAVAGYYTQSVLSSTSQVPTNGYVAALTYQVSGWGGVCVRACEGWFGLEWSGFSFLYVLHSYY